MNCPAVCAAVCLVLTSACLPSNDEGPAAARHRDALTVTSVDVDTPVIGPTTPGEFIRGAWNGQRHVVLLQDPSQTRCLTLLADGTLEGTTVLPLSGQLMAFALDANQEGHALLGTATGATWLRLGVGCQGPFTAVPVALKATSVGFGSLPSSTDFAVVTQEAVDGGPPHVRFLTLHADAGVTVDVEGRVSDWFNAACGPTACVAASQRNAVNGSPVSVDVFDLTTKTVNTVALAKDPAHQSRPVVAISGTQALIESGGGLSNGDQDFARRLSLAGALFDPADIDLGSRTVIGPSPNGYAVISVSTISGLQIGELQSGGFTAFVPLAPDVDGGAPRIFDPDATQVLWAGSSGVALWHLRSPSSSVVARAVTSSFAPNGPVQVLVPRVNDQTTPQWVSDHHLGSGYAVWLDSRDGDDLVMARRFDDRGRPLSGSVTVGFANTPYAEVAIWGERLLLRFDNGGGIVKAVLVTPDGGGLGITDVALPNSSGGRPGLATTDAFAAVFQRRFTGSAFAVEGTRLMPDGGRDTVTVTPVENFYNVFATSDDAQVYLAVPEQTVTALFRLDPTGALVPLGSSSLTALDALVGRAQGFCLLSAAKAECRARDGAMTDSYQWPVAGQARAVFDGSQVQVCVAPNQWLSLEPDGGVTTRAIGVSCGAMGAVGSERLVVAHSVTRDFSTGPTPRAVLDFIDLRAVNDGGTPLDAGVTLDGGSVADGGFEPADGGFEPADGGAPWVLQVGCSCGEPGAPAWWVLGALGWLAAARLRRLSGARAEESRGRPAHPLAPRGE